MSCFENHNAWLDFEIEDDADRDAAIDAMMSPVPDHFDNPNADLSIAPTQGCMLDMLQQYDDEASKLDHQYAFKMMML